MHNRFSDKSEALLRDRVIKNLDEKRSGFSSKFLTTTGNGFKIAVIIAWVANIYNLIMFLAQTFGFWLLATDNPVYTADARNITICVVLIAIATILMALKLNFSASVATTIFAIFYLVNSFALWTSEVIYSSKMVTAKYLYVPSTFIALAIAVYFMAIIILTKVQFKTEYNRLIDKITSTYPSKEGEVTTAEQWEEYISNYMEPTEHKKPKKSLRSKTRKQSSEVE